MPELLLELFSEEIPARMQVGAARDLARMAAERLKAQELTFDALRTYAGPRRLTLVVEGLPAATPDRAEEIKGPKASAPPQALEGFLRKWSVAREELAERDGVLFLSRHREGRATPEIAAEIVREIVWDFPWPKSMRSGSSDFRWVRPLHRVLFLFDGQKVPWILEGIEGTDVTSGHRFMGSGKTFTVGSFDDYKSALEREFVILDAADRRRRILDGAQAVCRAAGLELVEDEGLLEEVAGLAEWPTPVLGEMDPAFLSLPPEVIRTSMRTHQKYFSVRRPGEAGLSPHFVVVANVEAPDGGAELARGNARVLSARLNDARFFWDEDRKPGAFDRWGEKLGGVTFHAKLGTMAERVERIAALAREIAPAVGADPDLAERAARLAKADLASAMVGEFPELQGVMGGYYAREALPLEGGGLGGGVGTTVPQGRGDSEPSTEPTAHTPSPDLSPLEGERRDAIADAIRDHYKPVGPSDSVPTAPVTVAVALADKLDTLVGFFNAFEKPTGSRDPYALRRSALGVIHILQVVAARLPLRQAFAVSAELFKPQVAGLGLTDESGNLLEFFADRLKVQLREEGRRHDLVDAVFALGDDDLVRIVDRVEALSGFLATEDGANLLAGYKRAVNILRAEAKKFPDEVIEALPLEGGGLGGGVGTTPAGLHGGDSEGHVRPPAHTPNPGPSPLEGEGGAPEETALRHALTKVQRELEPRLAAEDFAGAMASLVTLRAPVDAFFERVLVNDPDPAVRLNRLRLLASIRDAANRVADFSLIQS